MTNQITLLILFSKCVKKLSYFIHNRAHNKKSSGKRQARARDQTCAVEKNTNALMVRHVQW